MHGIEHGDISPYGRVRYHCRPMRHPADRPRLKTLFVPASSRVRRRHTAGRRRRVYLVVAGVVVISLAAGAAVFRDKLMHLVLRKRPATMVRDVPAEPPRIRLQMGSGAQAPVVVPLKP